MAKKQVIFIHGGTTFKSYKDYLRHLNNLKIDLNKYREIKWSSNLAKNLGSKFDVLTLKMPNPVNAQYAEWKILFKKIAPLVNDKVILVGHSLGGVFLAKYLSENNFPKKIIATLLVAPPYDSEGSDEYLGDFVINKKLTRFEKQSGKIFIYQSKDDKVVPYAQIAKYKNELPNAVIKEFKNRGHFNQPNFKELVKDMKAL